MTKTIEDLFIYLRLAADLIILLLFFVYYKKVFKEKGLITIAVFCLFDLTINVLINSITFNHKAQILILAFFTLVEYSLFTYFIFINIRSSSVKKVIIWISSIFFPFIIIYNLTTDARSIDSVPIGVETILILIFSFYYLYEQMTDSYNLFVYSKYQFWVVTGFMIYLAGSFFIYIFANQVERKVLNDYWFLTNAFFVLGNIFFTLAFLIYNRSKNRNGNKPKSGKLQPYLN